MSFALLVVKFSVASGTFVVLAKYCDKPIAWLRYVLLALVCSSTGTALAATSEDFEGPPVTHYDFDNCAFAQNPAAQPPQILAGGPPGSVSFLRLASTTPPLPISNSITFDRSDPGAYAQVEAEFDFRMILTPGFGRADGLGFALLDTAAYGTSGTACPLDVPEEPMFDDSLGVGFDIYQSTGDPNDNHVSVHYDNTTLCVENATPVVDLAGGGWIHARIVLDLGAANVSVILTAPGEPMATLIDSCAIPGLMPYEGRVFFGARSGGASADHDLDNVVVTFLSPVNAPPVADAGPRQSVNPGDPVILDGTGSSDLDGDPITFVWAQVDGPPVALSDPTSSQPDFTAPAMAAELSFQLVVNDGTEDGPPDSVGVTVAEPALIGTWGPAFDAEIVPGHTHLLPTGEVLYWEGGGFAGDDPAQILGENRLWHPVTGALGDPADPPFDAFCSGHSFLEDGTLLVTGGHDLEDGVGLPDAAIYDPVTDTWVQIPDMGPSGEGRWYPTNTTLDNGNVLVLSGSKDVGFTENRLPQIWRPAENDWLDLTDAEAAVSGLPEADHPLGSKYVLYPRMFLAPDGRVFKADANPNQKTWFLDTTGLGTWIEGPMTNFPGEPRTGLGGSRDYGTAVNYETGKILIVGGGDPPTATAEVIDLNDPVPSWRLVSPMADPRRHLNATLLPDGKVLVVGGTSSPEFNNAAEAVLEAEMWNPGSEAWSTVASMRNARVYHSVALLLPDGRVLAGGGGRPGPEGDVEQKNFEVYSPPYLFSGARPSITSAPQVVAHGRTFFLETPDAASITDVNWIRLPSVTHAFDQNQRLNRLSFFQTAGGLQVTAPASPRVAPPGHYMLFILTASGIPSVASIIQLVQCPTTGCPWPLAHANYCCDDGDFCNGAEVCNATGSCDPGTPPVCDDGLFCNGAETCNAILGCQAGSDPCAPMACDEGGDICLEAEIFSDGFESGDTSIWN